jgi:hypothetical protein
MAMPMSEYEQEVLPELEWESEHEWEGELDGEFEGEEFLSSLRNLAGRAAGAAQQGWRWLTTEGSPQRAMALTAARTALQRGLPALGGVIGGRFGAPALGAQLGSWAGGQLSGLLPEREYEGEFEWELDGELSPLRRVYTDALMEHLGHAATAAPSEAEAEALAGAMVPLAARVIPQAAPAVLRAAPNLVRGVSAVTRTLRRSPTTRPLVRAVPTIVRRTAANIAQQVGQGQPVSPSTAVRTLARQTARVLASPQQCMHAYRRSRILDQRFHRAAMPQGTP